MDPRYRAHGSDVSVTGSASHIVEDKHHDAAAAASTSTALVMPSAPTPAAAGPAHAPVEDAAAAGAAASAVASAAVEHGADHVHDAAECAFVAVQELWPPAGQSDIRIPDRRLFMTRHYVSRHGHTTGLQTKLAVVRKLTVDGNSCLCLLSHEHCFEVRRVLRSALYGEVVAACVLTAKAPSSAAAAGTAAAAAAPADVELTRTSVWVAIKRMSKGFVLERRDTTKQELPIQEDPLVEAVTLQYLANPGHPNIVRLHALLEDRDNYYSVQEMAGDELYNRVANPSVCPAGRLDEAVARSYFAQFINGLEYLHSRGVAHLDLSLENLLLKPQDHSVRIIDFGLARRMSHRIEPGARVIDQGFPARSMMPTNKTYYLAPEIFALKAFSGVLADLWSAATILFIMLTGTPVYDAPVERDRKFAALRDLTLQPLIRHWELDTFLSPAAQDLLCRMLVVSPPERRLLIPDIKAHPWMQMA